MSVMKRLLAICAALLALAIGLPSPAPAQTVLRVVMHSDLKIIDPI
jgi:hypothetical protein